jgi:hypothetical protein
MWELIQATVAHVDAIATRSSFAAGSFFGQPRWMCIVLGVRNEQIHLLTLRTSPSFGRLKYFFEDCDLEAVVSQEAAALHRAPRFESPLNSRPSMVR